MAEVSLPFQRVIHYRLAVRAVAEGDPGICNHDVLLSLFLSLIGSHPTEIQTGIHTRCAALQRGGRGDWLPRTRALGQELKFSRLGHCHVALAVDGEGLCASNAGLDSIMAPFLGIHHLLLPFGFCAGVWQEECKLAASATAFFCS